MNTDDTDQVRLTAGGELRESEKACGLAIGETADSRNDLMIRHAAHLCHRERAEANATPNRSTPANTVPEDTASGSSHEAKSPLRTAGYQGTDFSRAINDKNRWALAPRIFKRIILIMRAMLREIFDESAYDRFLMRTQASRSIASYRQFVQERDEAVVKKPRCC